MTDAEYLEVMHLVGLVPWIASAELVSTQISVEYTELMYQHAVFLKYVQCNTSPCPLISRSILCNNKLTKFCNSYNINST